MPTSKKPRKKYRPREKLRSPLHWAMHGASLLRPSELRHVTEPMQRALDAMREGRAVPDDVAAFTTAMLFLRLADKAGIVTEADAYLAAAESALEAICARAYSNTQPRKWTPPTLYASELDALDVLRALFRHLMENVSVRELDKLARQFYAKAAEMNSRIINRKPNEAPAHHAIPFPTLKPAA